MNKVYLIIACIGFDNISFFINGEVFIPEGYYLFMIIEFEDIKPGYDIILVGAGRAGYSFISAISDKFNILVIDSKSFPRSKACSGVLVEESIKYLYKDLDNVPLSKPAKIDVEYVDWDNNLEGLLKKKSFVNTDRFGLDEYFFDQMKDKKNVDFVTKTKLIEFDSDKSKDYVVGLCESNGVVKSVVSKYLVGCDGATSIVRRKIFKKDIDFYIAIQELIPTKIKLEKAFFILDSSLTDFYCWVIPKDNYVEIGGLFHSHNSNKLFEDFKLKLSKRFGITGKGSIEAAIVLRPKNLNDICFGQGNVFLCGEAAGLISPRSAEGISYALQSGEVCANTINFNKKNLINHYKIGCKSILNQLTREIDKSKIFSNVSKRKKLFD